jgi:hypothetical protein
MDKRKPDGTDNIFIDKNKPRRGKVKSVDKPASISTKECKERPQVVSWKKSGLC